MKDGSGFEQTRISAAGHTVAVSSLHPAWRALIRYCSDMKHGEIDRLKIQDGLPVIAEVTRQKIKFPP